MVRLCDQRGPHNLRNGWLVGKKSWRRLNIYHNLTSEQRKKSDDFGNGSHKIKTKLLNRESNGNTHVGNHLGKKLFQHSYCSYESNHKMDLKLRLINKDKKWRLKTKINK